MASSRTLAWMGAAARANIYTRPLFVRDACSNRTGLGLELESDPDPDVAELTWLCTWSDEADRVDQEVRPEPNAGQSSALPSAGLIDS